MTNINGDQPKRLLAADPEIASRLEARHQEIISGRATSTVTRAGLTLGGATLGLAAVANDAFAQGDMPSLVVDILNFALTLEYLESEFYTTGVGTANLIPQDMFASFDQIRKHEVAHVRFLQGVLGSQAVAKPMFDFTAGGSNAGPFLDVFRNVNTFAALAQIFEDTGVRAYKGQAANLMGHNAVLGPALRIHSVEARHASQVRRMRHQKGWITEASRGDLPAAAQNT